jgi:2-oxoglutarate ferredoxin oxidoreductase subunit alpha
MKKIKATNDFVIRFANVNGSGSASANNLFAKAIFRMGIPVSPKNIFPSNIQGLPTWYEVRVSEEGYLGRRGGFDFIVAVNGQTMRQDYEELGTGGYFFYDSTRPLPESFNRDDITVIGVPLTEICNREISNPRLRLLLKNIIYVGALAYLLNIEFSVLTDSLKKQFAKKPKLAEPNILALELGFNYAKEHYPDSCELHLKRSEKLTDHIIIDGNSALGLGAVYGGATVVGWYPITPSTSVIEAFSKFAKQYRRDDKDRVKAAIIQAEDELSALGIAMGACWNGARGFTATSGPGVSLMNEFLGLSYFAEIPVVLVDVQRAGPSTGMPTRTQQSDLFVSAYASHGDTKHILLFPHDPEECFEMAADSFDLAEQLQTAVIIMTDLDLGMNDHVCAPPQWDDKRRYNRGKVLSADQLEEIQGKWGRYHDIDGDGICYRTIPGIHPQYGSYFTRGSSHNTNATYTEDNLVYQEGMVRLSKKWETAKSIVPQPHIEIRSKKADCAIIFFGSSTYSALEAVAQLAQKNIEVNTMRLRAIPFQKEVEEFIENHEIVYVIEQNRDGQMRKLLINECDISPKKLLSIIHFDGLPITARYISEHIEKDIKMISPPVETAKQGGK